MNVFTASNIDVNIVETQTVRFVRLKSLSRFWRILNNLYRDCLQASSVYFPEKPRDTAFTSSIQSSLYDGGYRD